ncbi:HAD-IIA family hydrolase [Propionibacterium australiense]|uniref:HAD-IIA family hydrolase n=1 Tax=Propionibacterium australiense TaxID=119981 RepID=A0A8B3FS59_9ACTN|nr:HAD-IIA family hydrolase [Propionibacterium australiense]RLP09106.1 HAD-IIA family hydrolase [Propionibacterium australiense]
MSHGLVSSPTEFASAYIFDLDGTIYLGSQLLPGAKRMIEELRRRRIPVRFLSNNPTRDPDMYVKKLTGLGLPTGLDDICNTVVTAVRWLRQNHPDAVLFPIAEEPLCRALTEAGFELSDDPSRIDIVIASYDRGFDYRKLQIAFDAIWFHKRAILVQTNPDRFCPFPGGRGEPDCAAITAAIEACTGATCQVNFGKPSPVMLTEALSGLDVDVADCVMVGDRLQTDIQMALDAGMKSACVLTGEASPADIAALDEAHRPTYVLDRVDRLIPARYWGELGWSEDDR